MELEESAKAAIQSNSGAEPEDHHSARVYRLCTGFTRYAWKYRRGNIEVITWKEGEYRRSACMGGEGVRVWKAKKRVYLSSLTTTTHYCFLSVRLITDYRDIQVAPLY